MTELEMYKSWLDREGIKYTIEEIGHLALIQIIVEDHGMRSVLTFDDATHKFKEIYSFEDI